MKFLQSILFYILAVVFLTGCSDDEASIGEIITPSNLQITANIIGQDANNPYGDGSGWVEFTISAQNALTYKLVPSSGEAVMAPNGTQRILFTEQGVNNYQVVGIAYGTGGVSTSTEIEVEVLTNYVPPQELVDKLVGNGSKTWRIKSEKNGHFGLGPLDGDIPTEWYGAGPNEKVGTGMYDDRYIFSEDGSFTHITDAFNDANGDDPSGTIFGRINLVDELGSTGGTVDGADVLNVPLDDVSGSWVFTQPQDYVTINLSGKNFIGYYTGGNHQYQIFDSSIPNELLLRTNDGNNEFTWWFIITSDEPEVDVPDYQNLVWSDDFDGTALDATKWTYDMGTGTDGWGNNEVQYYTDRTENVAVSDGTLKITAAKESFGGQDYTSGRIKTEGLYDFTYGRVEIKAKMTNGGGTWPALWLLGSDYQTNTWPNCGEIDILEYVGNTPNIARATVHYPGNSGGGGPTNTTPVANADTEFHIYEVIWSPQVIKFYVDGVDYHTVNNNAALPFNNDFFLILNVAMGGTLGGNIDPAFTSSSMEVDYVKVFQE